MSLPRLLAILAVTAALQAQSLSHRLDEIFAKWNTPDRPGAAFVLMREGKIRYSYVVGLANLESKDPITTKTQFLLASVSKQFTAMGVMILAQDEKLSFDDPLSRFCPEFPAWAKTITIRHLLNHMSGLPDYEELMVGKIGLDFFKPAGTHFEHEYTAAEAMAVLAKQPALRFSPGEKFEYSNSGYVVLAQVIERVSGMRFAEFLEERIFKPLGMRDSLVVDERKQEAGHLARSYGLRDGKWPDITASPLNGIYGEDNVVTTIEDAIRWDRALSGEKLVKKPMLEPAFTPGRLNSGEATKYGFGWFIDSFEGHPVYHHSGSWAGYRTWIWRCPELNETAILLSNGAGPDFRETTQAILQAIHPPPKTSSPE